jgi:hypothetical protein
VNNLGQTYIGLPATFKTFNSMEKADQKLKNRSPNLLLWNNGKTKKPKGNTRHVSARGEKTTIKTM